MDSQDGADVRVCTDPVECEELLAYLEAVAREQGWLPGTAMRNYPDTARYIALRENGVLAGGLQLVLPGPDGIRSYHAVWPEVIISNPSRTAHVTVLALLARYRNRPALFWSLCAELWRFLIAEDIEAVILEATPAMLARYCRLGFPLERIGDLREHWGEECYLCRMDLRMVAGAMLMQAGKSPIYRTLVGKAARSRR